MLPFQAQRCTWRIAFRGDGCCLFDWRVFATWRLLREGSAETSQWWHRLILAVLEHMLLPPFFCLLLFRVFKNFLYSWWYIHVHMCMRGRERGAPVTGPGCVGIPPPPVLQPFGPWVLVRMSGMSQASWAGDSGWDVSPVVMWDPDFSRAVQRHCIREPAWVFLLNRRVQPLRITF